MAGISDLNESNWEGLSLPSQLALIYIGKTTMTEQEKKEMGISGETSVSIEELNDATEGLGNFNPDELIARDLIQIQRTDHERVQVTDETRRFVREELPRLLG